MKIKPSSAILLLILPTILVALVVLFLMIWRIPTRVELDLTVERAKFTVDAPETTSTLVLNSVDFQSIGVEKFTSIKLEPKILEVADPSQYDLTKDHFPVSAWKALSLTTPEITISKRNDLSVPIAILESSKGGVKTQKSPTPVQVSQGSLVTLEFRGDQNQTITIKLAGETPNAVLSISAKEVNVKALGTLDPIRASHGSDVTLQVAGKSNSTITIQLETKDVSSVLSVVLAIPGTFQLTTDNTSIRGIGMLPYQKDSLTYRVQAREDNPFVLLKGTGSLGINVQIPLQEKDSFFSTVAIPISALDLTRQDDSGNRVSAVVTGGEISYPDYPNIKKVLFEAPDFVVLDQLEQFHIKKMSLDSLRKGIRLRLGGTAGLIMTKSGVFLKDRRLSKFDNLWQNPRLIILFSIVAWVFPTTMGAYRLSRDLKGN